MTSIDSGTLTDTYDTLTARARRHAPGGVLLAVDIPGLIKRTASLCGTTPEAVTEALDARTAAARASAAA